MVSIDANDARPGTKLMIEGQLYNVIERAHHKPGKGGAIVRFKLKGLITGKVIDYTVRAGTNVEQADVSMKNMQFSFKENDQFIFMDMDSYEQIPVGEDVVGFASNFLREGCEAQITMFAGQIIGLQMPAKMEFEIIETVEGIKSNVNSTNVMKPAKIETGLEIQVPPFVKKGDRVRLSTEDGSYLERAN